MMRLWRLAVRVRNLRKAVSHDIENLARIGTHKFLYFSKLDATIVFMRCSKINWRVVEEHARREIEGYING